MDARITSAFWDDLEQQPSEVKLTTLWCMTNSSRDSCGVFRRSGVRFSFETGLAAHWLDDTIAKLPRMFVVDGEKVLLRNFIRYQIGVGPAMARNNLAKALTKPFQALPKPLQGAILDIYPELKPLLSPYQALRQLSNPLQTLPDSTVSHSCEAQENDSLLEGLPELLKHNIRRDKISTVQGECEGEPGVGDPTLQEVITRAALLGLSEPEARKFYDHYAALGWMYGQTRIVKWWHWLTRWKVRGESFAAASKKPASAPGTHQEIEDELSWQENPARREELLKKRGKL